MGKRAFQNKVSTFWQWWIKLGFEFKVGSILVTLWALGMLASPFFPSNQQTPSKKMFLDEIDAFVCQAGVSAIMGKPVSIMNWSSAGNKYHITYNRPSDNTDWGVYCWISSGRILWQTDGRDSNGTPGRVRNGKWDEIISYSLSDEEATINIQYTDGSSSTKKYKIPSLYKVKVIKLDQ